MKKMKRITCLAIAVLMALALAACGGNNGGEKSVEPSIAEIMEKAQTSMENISSMSYDMTMDIGMAVSNMTFDISTDVKADYIAEPIKMKMDMNMDMGILGSMQILSYMEIVDGTYYMYTGFPDEDGTMIWMKEKIELGDIAQYDAQKSMDLYIRSAESFKENGTEVIDGVNTTRYDGIISRDAWNEVLENTGVLEQLDVSDIDEISGFFDDLGDLPISIWIADETYIPMKYEMDMKDFMQGLMDKIMEEAIEEGEDAEDYAITITKTDLSMIMSNINGIDSIEIPEEALSAEELDFDFDIDD